ncbi:MAG: hydrolase, partial [Gammaproteobacteria bacterium]|nr:hydrolase [Gammaproteobacteria bacterium]
LPTAHLQTIWPASFRKQPDIEVTRERVELADGDFLDLDWYGNLDHPLVLINHGLEGSINSHYALPLMDTLHKADFASVFMHFRNCSEEPNRLAKAYHSGETGDIQTIIQHILENYQREVFAAIGFSLGGNALLKWLGESGKSNPLTCAAAVSVPFLLADSAKKLGSGFSQLYQWHLLRSLKQSYRKKFSTIEPPLNIRVEKLNSFREFDDKVTAPLHGFQGVDDYYQQSSSRQYLHNIQVPTCIIHSQDDPFMYQDSIPNKNEISEHVEMNISKRGGHVGFISGALPWKPAYWHEKVICNFLKRHRTFAD